MDQSQVRQMNVYAARMLAICRDSGRVAVNNGECQSGYGISFYHHKCDTCKCMIDQAWIERRKVALGNRKRQQQYQNQ